MMTIKKVIYYSGTLGKKVTSVEELVNLAEQKRAVATSRDGGKTAINVFPASTMLYRQAKDAYDLIQTGTLHEYIKPVRAAKIDSKSRWPKRKKPGLQDKINAAIEEVLSSFYKIKKPLTAERADFIDILRNILHKLDRDVWNICVLGAGVDEACVEFMKKLEESEKK